MDGTRDKAARDEAMPYGVDTIRLRISFPAAPASRGYDDRMWRMRPLRGWTGGAQWDEEAAAAVAAAAAQASASSSLRATLDRVIAAVEARAVKAQSGVQLAQAEPPPENETARRAEPNSEELSLPEVGRVGRYSNLRSQLQEIDPDNLLLQTLADPKSYVPTEADIDALELALARARARPPASQGPVNTFADPGGPAPQLTVGPTDYSVGLPPSTGANRGLVFVSENLRPPRNPKMREAYRYQAQTAGSSTDPATGRSAASPALRYDNPNPNGEPIVKWDGIQVLPDGTIELIDAKRAIPVIPKRTGPFTPPKFENQLERQSAALAQNPGFKGVIEVPTEEAATEAQDIIDKLGIRNISVRVRPLRP